MPRIAQAYISLILCSGATILLIAAGSWSSANLRRFVIFIGFAAISSTLKVRIPGIEGTMSPNFVFLVLAMVVCSFSEVTAITLAAALVQSLWAAKQARLIQVAFSPAALVLSVTLARQCAYLLLGPNAVNSPVAVVILAGTLYLSFNTASISPSLGSSKPNLCHKSPAFVMNVFCPISWAASHSLGWSAAHSLAVLVPVAVLGYLYSLSRTAAAAPVAVPPPPTEDLVFAETGS